MRRDGFVRSEKVRKARLDRPHAGSNGPKDRRRFQIEPLEERVVLANDLFIVPGAAGETYRLIFDWVSRDAAFQNEIGVYQVDDANGRVDGINPGAAGYSAAAAKRVLPIFKSGQSAGAQNEITVNAGQRLGLYLVQNNKTGTWQQTNSANALGAGPVTFFSFDAANPDSFDHVRSTTFANNSQTFSFEDQTRGGDQDFNDAVVRITLGRKDPLRVPGTSSQTVPATFRLESRQEQPRGEVGVIPVDDASGRVGSLLPGQEGYVAAALGRRQSLFAPTDNAPNSKTINLPGGSNFLYYLVDNGSAANLLQRNPTNRPGGGPLAFFSSFAASPDGLDHVRFLGNDWVGFEDAFHGGDRDFNDLILSFSFGNPTSTNVPPTVTARLINDTAGPGGTSTDKITSDPQIQLRVTDDGTISKVLVGLDNLDIANYQDVTSLRQPDGTILLDQAFLNSIGASNLLGLLQGDRTLRVRATDNTNLTTNFDFAFTFDNQIAPPTAALAPASDTGTAGDLLTNLAQVIIRGTAEAGSTVQVVGQSAQTTANNAGEYVLTNVSLQPGINSLQIRSIDRAGNSAQTSLGVTRDSEQPAISVQLVTDTTGPGGTASDSISSNPASAATITDNRAVTSLRAGIDPASDASLVDILSSLQPNGSVAFTLTLLNQLAGGTLSQGPHTLRIIAGDAAGNSRTVNFTFTFDSQTPTPTVQLDPNFDTGTSGDNITAASPIQLIGVAEPGALVTLVGTSISTTASNLGDYLLTNIPIVTGSNPFTIRSTDRAGNLAEQTIVITGAPGIGDVILPTVAAQLVNDTAGGVSGTTSDQITRDFRFNVQAIDNIGVVSLLLGIDALPQNQFVEIVGQLSSGSLVLSEATLNQLAGGTLSQGPHTLRLIALDAAGNNRSINVDFVLDSTTPTPTALLAAGSDSGTVGDLVTSAASVTIEGTAEPGALVEIVGTLVSVPANLAGAFSIPSISLLPGLNSFTIRSTDVAGNQASVLLNITRDSQAPILSAGLQTDTAGPGGSTSDGLTNDPTIAGTLTDNVALASLRVGIDAQTVDQYLEILSQVGVGGSFVLTPTFLNQLAGGTLAQGPHVVRFIARDTAGNTTNLDRAFVLDSVLANPTLSLDRGSDGGTVGDNITNLATVTINGTTDANIEVRLIQTGEIKTSGNDGSFSFSNVPLSLDNDGSNPLIVEARDRAGNLSTRGLEVIRRNAAPQLVAPIANINRAVVNSGNPVQLAVELADNFFDQDINNSLVRFNTTEGSFDMELFDRDAGRTVANFLNYVERGAYNGTFFHRRPTPLFVLQGGGFRLQGTSPTAQVLPVATDPNLPNQFGPSNTAGTVAMAKLGGDPNSATSQFFVNLVDNVGLDTNNGGFSVFAQIVPSTQPTINALSAIPTQNRGTPFDDVPLKNFPPGTTGNLLTPENLAYINSASVVRQVEDLTYTATVQATTNPNLLTLTANNRLIISLTPAQTGSATILVRATDKAGAFVENSFTVTIT